MNINSKEELADPLKDKKRSTLIIGNYFNQLALRKQTYPPLMEKKTVKTSINYVKNKSLEDITNSYVNKVVHECKLSSDKSIMKTLTKLDEIYQEKIKIHMEYTNQIIELRILNADETGNYII
jgi:hypothetical protein